MPELQAKFQYFSRLQKSVELLHARNGKKVLSQLPNPLRFSA